MTDATARALVERSFAEWQRGRGSPFDLLSDTVQWTLTGSGWAARTYHGKAEVMDKTVRPVLDKLAEAPTPLVSGIWASDGVVIARWEQSTATVDGHVYQNNYAWFLTFSGKYVLKGTVYLDLCAFYALVSSTGPRRNAS